MTLRDVQRRSDMVISATQRLYYVDYLRVLLIVLVIAHHAAQAYGPTGGTWPITNPEISPLLGPFLGVNTMLGMGLFFLLAGYFVPRSFDRRGARAFSRSRFLRLGLPNSTGVVWRAIGFIAAAGYYVYGLLLKESLPDLVDLGGKSWRSLVFCAWESLVLAGLGVGLLVLFRERLNSAPGKWLAALVGTAFGAYIFYLYIVIGVQAGMDAATLRPFIKFLIVTFVAAILSFGFVHLAKKAPGLRRFL